MMAWLIGMALRVAFWPINLRVLWSRLISFLRCESERASLPAFALVEDIELTLGRCLYEPDPIRGRLDYVRPAEYIQFLIDTFPRPIIGDCDDFHWYAANALQKVSSVEAIYFLSSGFKGGAHATTVFRQFGDWYHFDYKIYPLSDPNDAPNVVARRYTKDKSGATATWWVWEKIDPWGPVAIFPKQLDVTL